MCITAKALWEFLVGCVFVSVRLIFHSFPSSGLGGAADPQVASFLLGSTSNAKPRGLRPINIPLVFVRLPNYRILDGMTPEERCQYFDSGSPPTDTGADKLS
jgi:hypothetical protein